MLVSYGLELMILLSSGLKGERHHCLGSVIFLLLCSDTMNKAIYRRKSVFSSDLVLHKFRVHDCHGSRQTSMAGTESSRFDP